MWKLLGIFNCRWIRRSSFPFNWNFDLILWIINCFLFKTKWRLQWRRFTTRLLICCWHWCYNWSWLSIHLFNWNNRTLQKSKNHWSIILTYRLHNGHTKQRNSFISSSSIIANFSLYWSWFNCFLILFIRNPWFIILRNFPWSLCYCYRIWYYWFYALLDSKELMGNWLGTRWICLDRIITYKHRWSLRY